MASSSSFLMSHSYYKITRRSTYCLALAITVLLSSSTYSNWVSKNFFQSIITYNPAYFQDGLATTTTKTTTLWNTTTMTSANTPFQAITTAVDSSSNQTGNNVLLPKQPPHPQQFPTVPIIVDLTGELGNHLLHLAHGRAIQVLLQQQYGIPSRLVLKQISAQTKYQTTRRHLQACFPNIRLLKFHTSKQVQESQRKIWRNQYQFWNDSSSSASSSTTQDPWKIPSGTDVATARDMVDRLAKILHAKQQQQQPNRSKTSAATNKTRNLQQGMDDDGILSVPFLHSEAMMNREFMDVFYDDIREFFIFDEAKCCADLPAPDETVFHFRNFVKELSKKGKASGLEELSPHKTATELFANVHQKKIAIATRYTKDPVTQQYVQALQQEHNQVRIFTNHSAVQDFCAMRHANHLVGMVRSTFVVWAALLGDSNQTARLYSVDSVMARKRLQKKDCPLRKFFDTTIGHIRN